jgi:hypothetical protein
VSTGSSVVDVAGGSAREADDPITTHTAPTAAPRRTSMETSGAVDAWNFDADLDQTGGGARAEPSGGGAMVTSWATRSATGTTTWSTGSGSTSGGGGDAIATPR